MWYLRQGTCRISLCVYTGFAMITEITRMTEQVHLALMQYASGRDLPEVNAETLKGLCAVGAARLIELLAGQGITGVHMMALSCYGNYIHCWVRVGAWHLDPTWSQFTDEDEQGWRVSQEAPEIIWRGKVATITDRPLPDGWRVEQHPQSHPAF